MDKLKACPHCGGHAEIKDWTCGYESGTSVYCIQCGASVNAGVENGNGWHDRAIAAWNRRTAPENKPLTNFDRVTSSPKELADFLFDTQNAVSSGEFWPTTQDILNWLNQPYTRKPEGAEHS